mgnify:CR=1 FL=1
MGYVVDTSVLIDAERGTLDIRKAVGRRTGREFFLSVISASELLHGVHRAIDPGIRARRSAFVEGILARFPCLPIDLPIARIHAELWAMLQRKGTLVGTHDMWIAASALARGCTVATTNLREFRRVKGLSVELWK